MQHFQMPPKQASRYTFCMQSARFCATGLAIAICATHSVAQWTVTNLHPVGATESRAHGVSGTQQVGRAWLHGANRASLWKGDAETWVDLSPPGSVRSECWDVDRGRQVGSASYTSGQPHAALWLSTPGSYVDLHPANSTLSVAYGVDGETQAGSAGPVGIGLHAVTWKGTPESIVDHHPPAGPPPNLVRQSEFYGVRDGQLVGYLLGSSPRPFRGTVWSESILVDVTPALPPVPASMISCNVDMTSRGQHVGYAETTQRRAFLWTGSPLVAIDLTPANRSNAWAQGAWRGQQVGLVRVGSQEHAALWNGSAASWIDLQTFLPASFVTSTARAIWSDRFNTYAAGWGENSATGRTEALLWSRKSCWADLTHNEVVDDEDFAPFVVAYDELICPALLCPADLNDDGVVDDADFQLFVAAYDALLCP